MNIIDKREGSWRVLIGNVECPYLTYPNVQIACKLLDSKEDNYCTSENCPRKEV